MCLLVEVKTFKDEEKLLVTNGKRDVSNVLITQSHHCKNVRDSDLAYSKKMRAMQVFFSLLKKDNSALPTIARSQRTSMRGKSFVVKPTGANGVILPFALDPSYTGSSLRRTLECQQVRLIFSPCWHAYNDSTSTGAHAESEDGVLKSRQMEEMKEEAMVEEKMNQPEIILRIERAKHDSS